MNPLTMARGGAPKSLADRGRKFADHARRTRVMMVAGNPGTMGVWTMQISFPVDRSKAIRGGYNQCGEVKIDVDMEAMEPADRELIASCVEPNGACHYVVKDNGRLYLISAAAPTVEGLLDAIKYAYAQVEADKAERKRIEDNEVNTVAAKAAANLEAKTTYVVKKTLGIDILAPDGGGYGTGRKQLNYAIGREAEIPAWASPEWVEWENEVSADNDRRMAEAEAQIVAEKAAEEAAKVAAIQRLKTWTLANGSELSKARLADGYDCWVTSAISDVKNAIYGRFASIGPRVNRSGSTEERTCPTLAEIKAIREATNIAATISEWPVNVDLMRVEYTQESDDSERCDEVSESEFATEIRIRIDILPDRKDAIWIAVAS